MNQVLIYFKIAALAAVTFLCITMSMLVIKAKATLTKLDTAIASASSITANINKTLDEINRPCGGHASCGTIADFNRTLASVRGAVGQVEVAAKHENAQLSTLDAQEKTLYSDLHATLNNVNEFAVTGRQTELALQGSIDLTTMNTQPILAEAHESLAELTVSLTSLNAVISNQDIPKTLAGLQKTTEATQGTMRNIQATTGDVKDAVHNYLHPKWWQSVVSWSLKIGHALNPL
jgi:hypothetical protein